jgi:hypothetical protein
VGGPGCKDQWGHRPRGVQNARRPRSRSMRAGIGQLRLGEAGSSRTSRDRHVPVIPDPLQLLLLNSGGTLSHLFFITSPILRCIPEVFRSFGILGDLLLQL